MSAGMVRRLLKLEQDRAEELASRVKLRVCWVDPVTGERTDLCEAPLGWSGRSSD
jgi:hypothetical protein